MNKSSFSLNVLVCAFLLSGSPSFASDDSAIKHINTGSQYFVDQKYKLAEKEFLQAIEELEKSGTSGTKGSLLSKSFNGLAATYMELGKVDKVESLYLKSLAIDEKLYGPGNDPELATSLNNLAEFYRQTGKFAKATKLYDRALHIYEKTNQMESMEVAQLLNNKSILLIDEGKLEQAESLLKKVMTIKEKNLKPNDPSIGRTVSTLAQVKLKQKKISEAEKLLKRVIEIDEKAYGVNHPTVGVDVNNLASVYLNAKQYEKAIPLYQRAISLTEKNYGVDHPNLSAILSNLGVVYAEQGKYKEAQKCYERSLSISKKKFGPVHPSLVATSGHLANLYRMKGNYRKAVEIIKETLKTAKQIKNYNPEQIKIYERSYELWNKKLLAKDDTENGAIAEKVNDDSKVRISKKSNKVNLGSNVNIGRASGKKTDENTEKGEFDANRFRVNYEKGRTSLFKNDYDNAINCFLVAIKEARKLGVDDPRFIRTKYYIAMLHTKAGKYKLAEELLNQALASDKSAFSRDKVLKGLLLDGLGANYYQQKKYDLAIEYFQKALEAKKVLTGPARTERVITLNNLGRVYIDQKQYKKAEPMIRESIRVIENNPTKNNRIQSANLYLNLAEILTNTERAKEAATYEKKAQAIVNQFSK